VRLTPLPLPGLALVELTVHADDRGFFVERFRADRLAAHGLPAAPAQENHSRSWPGVLRGLHYQADPPQGKLVGVVRGRVWEVAVDLRPASPTFGRHVGLELRDTAGRLVWVPAGFAHGFCVLGDEPADVVYQVDAEYNPHGEGGIAWDDPDLAIAWPVRHPHLSARDRALPSFAQFRRQPVRW
jgi:dTDP-4-dehydrorhamnose 3,5-epimerase